MAWTVSLVDQAASAGVALLPPPAGAGVASLTHAAELDALCLVLSTGELLLLRPGQQGAAPVEEVGWVDAGVAVAEWSPGGEVLALLSGSGSLVLMSPQWEVLGEADIWAPPPPELGGAAAAAAPNVVASGGEQGRGGGEAVLRAGRAVISWRGDGRFLATCAPDATGAWL